LTNKELIEYWIKSSDDDYDDMLSIYENKNYTLALFIGHLVIEKLIKGIYAKNNVQQPYARNQHKLLLLAEGAKIKLTEEQERKLVTFDTFNISARYEDYKNNFREKCTKEYTSEQIDNIKEMRTWLK